MRQLESSPGVEHGHDVFSGREQRFFLFCLQALHGDVPETSAPRHCQEQRRGSDSQEHAKGGIN
jgi:hypothetical protein